MIKLFLDSKFWNILFLNTVIASMVIFIAITLLVSEFNKNSTDYAYKSYTMLLRGVNIWVATPVLVVAAILPNLLFLALQKITTVKEYFQRICPTHCPCWAQRMK